MKKLLLSIPAIVFSLLCFAQTSYFKGEWGKRNSEYVYSAFIKLTIKGDVVEGEIMWKLVKADKNSDNYDEYKSKIGLTAIEVFTGTLEPATKDLEFKGESKIDPNEIIGLDMYRLKISNNGQVIYGQTDTWDGTGRGRLYAIKQTGSTAAAEYNALRKKIE